MERKKEIQLIYTIAETRISQKEILRKFGVYDETCVTY